MMGPTKLARYGVARPGFAGRPHHAGRGNNEFWSPTMATDRTQSQSGNKRRGSQSQQGGNRTTDDSELELEGTTEEGVEVTASMEDDEALDGGSSASDESEESGGTSGGRGSRGGSGNFANDPQRAREAGRKGGKH
jgi:hypothetical protein